MHCLKGFALFLSHAGGSSFHGGRHDGTFDLQVGKGYAAAARR